jgi:CRISPR-associated protein Csc3
VQAVASISKFDDCLYDLARATSKPFSLYYVLLRWILREQDSPNLESSWQKICHPLNSLLESLMANETTELTQYLKEAARLAAEFNLRGNSFKRTSITEPFTAFLTSIRSIKPHMDLDFVFASLVQKYHTRLDRIRDHVVGETKFEQLKQYYDILRKLYEKVYHARPEKLLNDREDLEAAYLFFWQEAFQVVKARREAEAPEKQAKAEVTQTNV